MKSGMFFSGQSQNLWVNLIGFNLVWAMCVVFGNSLLILVMFLLLLHVLFHQEPLIELSIIFLLGLIGYCIDCVLTLVGVFRFEQVQGITPLWLLFLWFAFCATLRQSLSFLGNRKYLAVFAGACGGSFAYFAAAKLGAVEFGFPFLTTATLIALIWSVLFPLFLWMSQAIEGYLCPSEH